MAGVLEAPALAPVILAASNLAAEGPTIIPAANRVLVGRVVISKDRAVTSSSEVVSTTHSGDRSTRMDMGMGTTRIGMDTATRTPPAMDTTKTTAVAM